MLMKIHSPNFRSDPPLFTQANQYLILQEPKSPKWMIIIIMSKWPGISENCSDSKLQLISPYNFS